METLDYTFERQILLEKQEAWKEGFIEGFVESYTARMDQLVLKLNEKGRLDDLVKAATDIDFKMKLYEEFDILKELNS